MVATTFELGFQYKNRRWTEAAKGLRYFTQDLGRSVEEMTPALKESLQQYLDAVAGELIRRHSTPWKAGGSPVDKLFRRSGGGIKSILDSTRVEGSTLDNMRGHIGAAFPLSVHEKGATIRPRQAKYLAIPLPAALDASGVPLRPGPRFWDNTFVATSKKGNLLIFQRRGTQIVPLYVLKLEVKLPPRLGMEAALKKGENYFVDRAIEAMVKTFFV